MQMYFHPLGITPSWVGLRQPLKPQSMRSMQSNPVTQLDRNLQKSHQRYLCILSDLFKTQLKNLKSDLNSATGVTWDLQQAYANTSEIFWMLYWNNSSTVAVQGPAVCRGPMSWSDSWQNGNPFRLWRSLNRFPCKSVMTRTYGIWHF